MGFSLGDRAFMARMFEWATANLDRESLLLDKTQKESKAASRSRSNQSLTEACGNLSIAQLIALRAEIEKATPITTDSTWTKVGSLELLDAIEEGREIGRFPPADQ